MSIQITTASSSSVSAKTASYDVQNLGIAASTSGTISLSITQADGVTNPAAGTGSVVVGFRSTSGIGGPYVSVALTTGVGLNSSSGASLGLPTGSPQNVYIYLLNNAGTIEVAISATGTWDEGLLQSTTAMSGLATSSAVLYSATARTNVAVRLVGVLVVTQSSAGTYVNPATALKLLPAAKPPTSVSSFGAIGTVTTFTPTAGGPFVTPASSSTSTIYHYIIQGAGGGGGGSAGPSSVGSGGGAGGTAIGTFTGVAPSTSITLGVGNGGPGGSGSGSGGNGSVGGTSALLLSGGTISCIGGSGGGGGVTGTGSPTAGAAGGAVTGTPSIVGYTGGGGAAGTTDTTNFLSGGQGGASYFGGAAADMVAFGNPVNSTPPGAGGTGSGGQVTGVGGNGANGLIIITQLTP